jgi:hypothetical protein
MRAASAAIAHVPAGAQVLAHPLSAARLHTNVCYL